MDCLSSRQDFVNKYVHYLSKMEHVSEMTSFDNVFFQLILFLHKGSENLNDMGNSHKMKDNCFYSSNIFQTSVIFQDHGLESVMFTKYIAEFNPTISDDEFYSCDFKCSITFEMISSELKLYAQENDLTEKSLAMQQNELIKLKKSCEYSENFGKEYEIKLAKFKKNLIVTKNICLFRKLVKNTQNSTN